MTTVLLASNSGATSPVVAFKLGDKPHVIQDPVAIRFTVTGNLTSQGAALRATLQAGKAYADSFTAYDAAQAEYLKKKTEFDAAKAKAPATTRQAAASGTAEKKPEAKDELKAPTAPTKPSIVPAMEPFRDLFGGKIPALVEAKRSDAIKLAVQVFRDEFKVRTILIGADDASRVINLLADKDVAVAVGPELMHTIDSQTVNIAQLLANRGVPFAFQSKATTGVKMLPLAVQYAVRQGLGADDALGGLTAGPAKLLSIDNRVGVLAVGRDADLVVLSGPPFESSTRVLAVMIDGQWVHQEEDER